MRTQGCRRGDECVSIHARTGEDGYTVAVGEGYAWATAPRDFTITRIDPRTGETRTIELPGINGSPSGIGFGFQSVWVSDTQNGLVYRIDPATMKVISTITVAQPDSVPTYSDVVELDGTMWVTNGGERTVVPIDPIRDTVAEPPIQLPYGPTVMIAAYGSLWVTVGGI